MTKNLPPLILDHYYWVKYSPAADWEVCLYELHYWRRKSGNNGEQGIFIPIGVERVAYHPGDVYQVYLIPFPYQNPTEIPLR